MAYKSIDIKCPECESLAQFEEPFEFLSPNMVGSDETRPQHQWGGWVVIERFPAQLAWKAPSTQPFLRDGGDNGQGGYPLLTHGLVQCANCHVNERHKLRWPHDAYWQWRIRGRLLWAWDRDHAEAILAYVKTSVRPPRVSDDLRQIPAYFLSAKVRDLIVKEMEQSLTWKSPSNILKS